MTRTTSTEGGYETLHPPTQLSAQVRTNYQNPIHNIASSGLPPTLTH